MQVQAPGSSKEASRLGASARPCGRSTVCVWAVHPASPSKMQTAVVTRVITVVPSFACAPPDRAIAVARRSVPVGHGMPGAQAVLGVLRPLLNLGQLGQVDRD